MNPETGYLTIPTHQVLLFASTFNLISYIGTILTLFPSKIMKNVTISKSSAFKGPRETTSLLLYKVSRKVNQTDIMI